MELRMLRVSCSVLAFMLFQTGHCGIYGRLAKLGHEMSRMTPQQQIRAVDDFFVAEGRPSQLPPRPAAQPAPALVAVPAVPAPQPVQAQSMHVENPSEGPAVASTSAVPQQVTSPVSVAGQRSAPAFQYTLPEVRDSNAETGNTLSDWFFDTLRSGRSQREQSSEDERDSASSIGNFSYQSSGFTQQVENLSSFPKPEDEGYNILIGEEDNIAKGTIWWLVKRFISTQSKDKRKKVLSDFLNAHNCFSDLQEARRENRVKLTADNLMELIEKNSEGEDRIIAVYDEIARAVDEASVPVIETSLD